MRTFEQFPNNQKCPICGTNDNKTYTLVPIDGTENGENVEAAPVHIECLPSPFRMSITGHVYSYRQ